jgi:hypothetical protein
MEAFVRARDAIRDPSHVPERTPGTGQEVLLGSKGAA